MHTNNLYDVVTFSSKLCRYCFTLLVASVWEENEFYSFLKIWFHVFFLNICWLSPLHPWNDFSQWLLSVGLYLSVLYTTSWAFLNYSSDLFLLFRKMFFPSLIIALTPFVLICPWKYLFFLSWIFCRLSLL